LPQPCAISNPERNNAILPQLRCGTSRQQPDGNRRPFIAMRPSLNATLSLQRRMTMSPGSNRPKPERPPGTAREPDAESKSSNDRRTEKYRDRPTDDGKHGDGAREPNEGFPKPS
jgi:hypothetical protein